MTPTAQRDAVAKIAKTDTSVALERAIDDHWFRAQAVAHVYRWAGDRSSALAVEAATAAEECADAYQRCAVRAWEIAALAERNEQEHARQSLRDALVQATHIERFSSRSEALTLLLHAAVRLGVPDVASVAEMLRHTSQIFSHWRCDRAVVDAAAALACLSPDRSAEFVASLPDGKVKTKCEAAIARSGYAARSFFW